MTASPVNPTFWHGAGADEGGFATDGYRPSTARRSTAGLDGTVWTRPTAAPVRPDDPAFDSAWLRFPNPTPVRVAVLIEALTDHPNRDLVTFVRDMLECGVTLGVNRDRLGEPDAAVPNLPSARSPGPARSATLSWIDTEVKAGRLRGPWRRPPHPDLYVWPVGAIPKSRKIPIAVKARVITHFSFGSASLNDAIDGDCTIEYLRYVDVIDEIQRLLEAGADVWLIATDLKDAYRIVPVAPQDLHLQGLRVVADDGTELFYVDTCLGFGTRSGPRLFDSLAQAIHWVLQHRCDQAGLSVKWYHLLDDFLGIAASRADAEAADRIKSEFFEALGIPEQPDKRVAPTRRLKYLGLLLDVDARHVSAPADKRLEMIEMLQNTAALKSIRTTDLGRVCGQLCFYGIAFPRLRPLVSSLYAALAVAQRKGWWLAKPSRRARDDAAAIAKALRGDPATPFTDFYVSPWSTDDVAAIDASGPDGCGGFSVTGNYVFHCPWPAGFCVGDDDISTCLQEMMAASLLVDVAPEGSSLTVWTDSRAFKDSFGKGRSPSVPVNELLRVLLTTCAARGVHLVVAWHRRDSSVSAIAADHLSHGDFQAATALVPALSGARRLRLTSRLARLCGAVSTATQAPA